MSLTYSGGRAEKEYKKSYGYTLVVMQVDKRDLGVFLTGGCAEHVSVRQHKDFLIGYSESETFIKEQQIIIIEHNVHLCNIKSKGFCRVFLEK